MAFRSKNRVSVAPDPLAPASGSVAAAPQHPGTVKPFLPSPASELGTRNSKITLGEGAKTSTRASGLNLFGGKATDAASDAQRIQELERAVQTNFAGLEALRAMVAHNALMETLREDGVCPLGHRLQPIGTTKDNGWCCHGSPDGVGGCKSLITGPNQTEGMNRFRCEDCDYDLCQKCYRAAAQEDVKMAKIKEDTIADICGKMDELAKNLNADTRIEVESLLRKLERLEGRVEGLAGTSSEHAEWWDSLQNEGKAAAERAHNESGTLKAQVADLSMQMNYFVQKLDETFQSAQHFVGPRSRSSSPTRGGSAVIRQGADGTEDFGSRPASPRADASAWAATVRRLDAVCAVVSTKLQGFDGRLEQLREEAVSAKVEAALATRSLADKITLEMDSTKTKCTQLESSTRLVSECAKSSRETAELALREAPSMVRRMEMRVERLEMQGINDAGLAGQRVEARVEALAAQLHREVNSTSQVSEQRLENLALQRCRDVHDGLQRLTMRMDKVEAARQRDASDLAQRVEMRLSTMSLGNIDMDLDRRDRKITERIDLLASHLGVSVQQLERKFREFRSDVRTFLKQPTGTTTAVALEPARTYLPPASTTRTCSRSIPDTEWNYRVEWDVSEKDFTGYQGPRCCDSPEFSLGSVNGLHLRFHPSWDANTTSCLLAVIAPYDLGLLCKLSVDGHAKEGKPLELAGCGSEGASVCYAADFPAQTGSRYHSVAVEFAGQAVPRKGLLRLA